MSAAFSLQSLLLNYDLQSYIEANFAYKPVHNSSEYRVCCVACGNPNFKLYINVDKKQFNCFTCDFSSKTKDLFDLVAKNEGISRGQAIQQFALTFRRTVPDDFGNTVEDKEIAYEPTTLKITSFPVGLSLATPQDDGWKYLSKRGLTDEEITNCRVRFTNKELPIKTREGKLSGNLKNRVVFPVYGPPGLVSWQGRTVVDGLHKDKYFSCPGSDLSKTLWPFVPPYGTTAVIVEGTLDAIAIRRLPNVSSYASFGKKLSRDQIALLKTWNVDEVVIFFDKKDALPQIKSTVKECKNHFNKVTVPDFTHWPSGIDAGDCLLKGIEPIKQALENRIDSYSLEYTNFCLQ